MNSLLNSPYADYGKRAASPPSAGAPSAASLRRRNGIYLRLTGLVAAFALGATGLLYDASLGVNLVLACALAVGVSYLRRRRVIGAPADRPQLAVQFVVWAMLAVAAVWHFDPWTVTTLLLATVVLCGGCWFWPQADPLRALALGALQLAQWPASYVRSLRGLFRGGRSILPEGSTLISKFFVPLAVSTIFAWLYIGSNSKLNAAFIDVSVWLSQIKIDSDVARFALIVFCWSLVGATLVYVNPRLRKRSVLRPPHTVAGPTSSVSAWSTASLTLLCVNVLALVLNVTDGGTTWLGEVSRSGEVLKRGVHTGTSTLITAVILASGLILYYLRHRPSDYKRADQLALAWLGQNGLMVATVALRNYHYTDAYGLTYKRIGVYLFLLCTLSGLWLLGRASQRLDSVQTLLTRQAWAMYAVLALAALPNWPAVITRYNLRQPEPLLRVDRDYLYEELMPYNFTTWLEILPEDAYLRQRLDYHLEYRTSSGNWAISSGWRAWDFAEHERAAVLSELARTAELR